MITSHLVIMHSTIRVRLSYDHVPKFAAIIHALHFGTRNAFRKGIAITLLYLYMITSNLARHIATVLGEVLCSILSAGGSFIDDVHSKRIYRLEAFFQFCKRRFCIVLKRRKFSLVSR